MGAREARDQETGADHLREAGPTGGHSGLERQVQCFHIGAAAKLAGSAASRNRAWLFIIVPIAGGGSSRPGTGRQPS